MPNLLDRKVAEAQNGENPIVITPMLSGWAVIGDQPFIPGYCLLLADPVFPDLNTLALAQRTCFLANKTIIGVALLEVIDSDRINYEILGNSAPALHAHIFPVI